MSRNKPSLLDIAFVEYCITATRHVTNIAWYMEWAIVGYHIYHSELVSMTHPYLDWESKKVVLLSQLLIPEKLIFFSGNGFVTNIFKFG